jgi:effector-binding domain-containing protein
MWSSTTCLEMVSCTSKRTSKSSATSHRRTRCTRPKTPAGRVATVAHWGAYDQMQPAYAALDEWCKTNGEPRWQLRWEVYGDWSDNPQEVRTDIFYALSRA